MSSKLINYRKKCCSRNISNQLTQLEQIILEKEKPQKKEIIDLWDSIMFYNFCQKGIKEFNDKPPTLEILEESLNAFLQIIEEYTPNILITFSKYVSSFIISKMNCNEIYSIDDISIYTMKHNDNNITLCYLNTHLKGLNWKEK